MTELVRHSLAMLRNPRLIAVHLAGNAALAAATAFWLLIPEAHIWQLLFAGISALAIVFIFLWIHAGTLAYGAEPAREKFADAFRPQISRLVWMAVGVFILFLCMRTVDGWKDSTWQISGYVYSKAPSFLRPTSGPTSYANYLAYAFLILQWYVLPCIFLPVIAARVIGAGALAGLRTLARWQYWVATAVTALVGICLTRVIVDWVPGMTLGEQTLSLVLRLGIAYVLATAGWLITAGALGFFVRRSSTA